MKKLIWAMLIATASASSHASTVSVKQKAEALVQAKYLGSVDGGWYETSDPARVSDGVIVHVTRHAGGGPCTILVQFLKDGRIVIEKELCQPGS
jgi:hypothetical protein